MPLPAPRSTRTRSAGHRPKRNDPATGGTGRTTAITYAATVRNETMNADDIDDINGKHSPEAPAQGAYRELIR